MLPSSQQPPRVNLFHLKSQIEKKLGPDKSVRYFSHLNDFLSERLSKPGFSKFCSKNFGQENIHLHNKLIRAIFKNACFAKTPPMQCHHIHNKGFVRPSVRQPGDKDKKSPLLPALDSGVEASQPMTSSAPFWSANGDIWPQAPWRSKSGVSARKLKNRHTTFGVNGKTNGMPHASLSNPTVRENGSLMAPCEFDGMDNVAKSPPPSKKPRTDKPSYEITKLGNDANKVMSPVKGGRDEQEYIKDVCSSWRPLQAPLGIPFCPASVGGAQRSSPFSFCGGISSSGGNGGNILNNCSSGELCHTDDLKNRLDRMVETHDLGSVASDCAILLNKAVDSYLIRLIKPCVDLLRAKTEQKRAARQPNGNGKFINDVLPGNHMHVHNMMSLEESQSPPRSPCIMSVLDFMLAMNLNPQLLGEDFPSLREKLLFCSFEEE